MMRSDMLLSDMQYVCLHLLQLSTGHGYQCNFQTEEIAEKSYVE